MSEELVSAANLDRVSLHTVVYDMRAWLINTEKNYRYKAKRRAKTGDVAGRRELLEQAEGLAQCRAKLDDLVNQLKAATKVVNRTAPIVVNEEPEECVDDPSVYLPTPEEIAAKTEEIRRGWRPSEHEQRHWQKAHQVDLSEATKFIF